MTQAYPLQWPFMRPRTSPTRRKTGRFSKKTSNGMFRSPTALTVSEAVKRVGQELERIGAWGPVISTNVEVRLGRMP